MKIWDPNGEKYIIEDEYGNNMLQFLYNTVLGRGLLKIIFARRWFSKLVSLYYKSPFSKNKIKRFSKRYNIKLDKEYKNFNDFFIRKKEVATNTNSKELIAIADSYLSVYNVDNSSFKIKNSRYNLSELICDKKLAKEYEGGIILIYRLALNNYHRYVFLDNGRLIYKNNIKGELHTVRKVSSRYKVFVRNSRVINIMETENFGDVLQVEVGAILIGKIVNHDISDFSKLDEKGYFEYGGSTIIQVFKKDKIKLDKRIKPNVENVVKIGEKVGEVKC